MELVYKIRYADNDGIYILFSGFTFFPYMVGGIQVSTIANIFHLVLGIEFSVEPYISSVPLCQGTSVREPVVIKIKNLEMLFYIPHPPSHIGNYKTGYNHMYPANTNHQTKSQKWYIYSEC